MSKANRTPCPLETEVVCVALVGISGEPMLYWMRGCCFGRALAACRQIWSWRPFGVDNAPHPRGSAQEEMGSTFSITLPQCCRQSETYRCTFAQYSPKLVLRWHSDSRNANCSSSSARGASATSLLGSKTSPSNPSWAHAPFAVINVSTCHLRSSWGDLTTWCQSRRGRENPELGARFGETKNGLPAPGLNNPFF